MAAYVVKEWNANSEPDSNGRYVHIRGRAPGLLSWFLSLMDIDPIVELEVTDKHFIFKQGSMAGQSKQTVLLHKVTATSSGYHKPWKEAALFAILLAPFTFGLSIILGIVYYLLGKKMTIAVSVSGNDYAVDFKRSVIEGVKIDEIEAYRVAALIQGLVDAGHAR